MHTTIGIATVKENSFCFLDKAICCFRSGLRVCLGWIGQEVDVNISNGRYERARKAYGDTHTRARMHAHTLRPIIFTAFTHTHTLLPTIFAPFTHTHAHIHTRTRYVQPHLLHALTRTHTHTYTHSHTHYFRPYLLHSTRKSTSSCATKRSSAPWAGVNTLPRRAWDTPVKNVDLFPFILPDPVTNVYVGHTYMHTYTLNQTLTLLIKTH